MVVELIMFAYFGFGAIVGSFLNVCIYRIPLSKSIVSPGSSCPSCCTPIPWYQNIPILSWVALGGKCFVCKEKISLRYPLVEALTGMLFLLVGSRYGMSGATLVYWVFYSILVVITFIDIDYQIIPNVLSLSGVVIGVVCAIFLLPLSWSDSLLGVLLGGGGLWVVATVYRALTGVEGMGMGDVKLLAMIGAFLGWNLILPVVFLSSLAGTLVGIPLMLYKKSGSKLAIPFGPFLALGAIIAQFAWPALFTWYVTTFLKLP